MINEIKKDAQARMQKSLTFLDQSAFSAAMDNIKQGAGLVHIKYT